MDSGVKCQDGGNISPIMKLPEEAMREVFNNMSFQTLYFSLRRVCKNIQSYVDNYLKVRGGTSFFVGCRNGSEKEVIESAEKPKKRFIILRTPATSIPWVTSKLQNIKILDKDRYIFDRYLHMLDYAAIYETGVCHIYKGEISITLRYDQERWKFERAMRRKFSDNQTPLNNETSHDFIRRLVSEIIPHFFEIHSYHDRYYPFVQVNAKDKTWCVGKIMPL